jgi:hypothetical protein
MDKDLKNEEKELLELFEMNVPNILNNKDRMKIKELESKK